MNHTAERIQVTIDDRERASQVAKELEKFDETQLKIERLVLGDYCVDGAVLIERKSAADFASSLVDGRMFSQASRMAISPLRPAYIVEGIGPDWQQLGVSRAALQGALITLTLVFDIPCSSLRGSNGISSPDHSHWTPAALSEKP